MAKGLGAIMAAVSIAKEHDAVENGESIVCPICGKVMENGGVAFFCYATQDEYGTSHPCIESTRKDVKDAFFNAFFESKGFGASDEWQGLLIAAVVDQTGETPKVLAELRTVRGPRGKTNLSASANFGEGLDTKDLPGLVQQFGWTFQEWFPEKTD